MIKILAGKYKNKKLKHFNFTNVRPTQARVKKSMFDSLTNIKNKRVLDLFCGVGTLGIEALSRGATSVTFVDNNHKSINLLKENLSLLSITNKGSIIYCDVFKFLNKRTDIFDVIIADPPYNKYYFTDFGCRDPIGLSFRPSSDLHSIRAAFPLRTSQNTSFGIEPTGD